MQRLQEKFHALGSEVFITLIAGNSYLFDATFTMLHEEIVTFENRFSRFLPGSELTRFNELAGEEVVISTEFRNLLRESIRMSRATDNLYNPFVLPALQKAGYKGSWPTPTILAGSKDFTSRKVVHPSELMLFGHTARIPAGSALDFGGIGKGYLLDKLHRLLQSASLIGYWVSLGGDIVCAGYDLEREVWSVQVQLATDNKKVLTAITNTSDSPLFIATSGITKRRGNSPNGPWHHIINPITGKPADTHILTATVTADSGAQADIYAKAIVIAGEAYAMSLKQTHNIRSFILQYDHKGATINL